MFTESRKKGFTPLEKAAGFNRRSCRNEADVTMIPPSPQTVGNPGSLTGFTLVELMLAGAILTVALVGLLGSYILSFSLNETAKNMTLAAYAIEQQIEEIRDSNFNLVFNDYNNTVFRANNTTLLAGNPIQISFTPNLETAGSVRVDNSDPDLLKITVSMCWRQQNGRIIGEDNGRGGGIALNGVLDGAEDANGNGMIDSPAMMETLMANR